MTELGQAWVDMVCAACDPVFESADVGFVRQVLHDDPEKTVVSALLWEADPERFAARYPDSGIVESYGEQWSGVHCIDFWAYVDHKHDGARISVEGWNLPDVWLPLRGDLFDGHGLANLFARTLGVRPPEAEDRATT